MVVEEPTAPERTGAHPFLRQTAPERARLQEERHGPRRLTLTVEEAARLLGISRALGYELVARGEVPSIRLGRRIGVPRLALDTLLDTGTTEASA